MRSGPSYERMKTDEVTIAQHWERRAALDPDHVYCRFGDEVFTIGGMNDRINQLANGLIGRGAKPGDRVAVMLPSHPDHIITIFALAKAGLIRIPVNVHLKGAALDFVFEKFDPHWLIADHDHASVLSGIIELRPAMSLLWRKGEEASGFANVMGSASCAAPTVKVGPDDVIAITPSSGTTGEPKGVLKTDRSLRAGPMGTLALTAAKAGDVFLLWEPLHHGAGVSVLIAALLEPLTLVQVDRFSVSQFWEQVRRYGVTHIHYLGGVLPLLLKQPPSDRDRDHAVRMAWGGGCPLDVWRAFEQRFGIPLHEGYGLSEMTTFVTINPEGRVGSCGRALPFYEVKLRGEDGNEVQAGETGEIVVRSLEKGLAFKGYFRMPEASADLVRDGWFSTGDLARADEDGFLFYAGRKKDSVRRRGVNISAWEVERIMSTHEDIEECALIGVPSEMGDDDLKLFIRPVSGRSPSPLDIIHWCESRLPYFQIPRYIENVEDFPRTPTQRIRKSELPRGVERAFDLEKTGYRIRK